MQESIEWITVITKEGKTKHLKKCYSVLGTTRKGRLQRSLTTYCIEGAKASIEYFKKKKWNIRAIETYRLDRINGATCFKSYTLEEFNEKFN